MKAGFSIVLCCALCGVLVGCSGAHRASSGVEAASVVAASQPNQNAPVAQQTLEPTPTPLSEKDLKERAEIHRLMLAGNNQHDGAIALQTSGDMSSVPPLLKVLEDNPPKHGMLLCTFEHAVVALRKITKHDAGFDYERWKAWWEQYRKEHPQN